jgi:hypothetical protein
VNRHAAGALLLISSVVRAQPPAIGQNGVANAASQIPPTLAGGTLTAGARFVVTGVRLADASLVFSNATGSWKARVLSSTPKRLEAVVPEGLPLGSIELRALNGALSSQPFQVTVVRSSPGLYSRNGRGWGPGRIRNLSEKGDVSFDRSARPGDRIAIAATGAADHLIFHIGEKVVKDASLQPLNEPGEEKFILRIPASAPEGCFVPLYVETTPAAPISNVVTIAIRRAGGACLPSAGSPMPLLRETRVGVIVLARTAGLSKSGLEKWTDDNGTAAFATKQDGPATTPLLMMPPKGTCTVYTGSSQSSFTMPVSLSAGLLNDLGDDGFDAGRVLLAHRGAETREIPFTPGALGYYNAPMGTSEGKRRPLFLNPGELFTVTAAGNVDLPIRMPDAVDWTNRDQIAELHRSRPVTLSWTPARPGQTIYILAANADQFTTARAMCFCAADGRDGRFTIPAAMLANFPVTYDVGGKPVNQLGLAASTGAAAVQSVGIGLLAGMGLFINTRIVDFR